MMVTRLFALCIFGSILAAVSSVHADVLVNGDFELGQFGADGDDNFVEFAPGYTGTIVAPGEDLLLGWDVSLSDYDPDQALTFGPPFGLEWTEGQLESERWVDLNRGGDLFKLTQVITTEIGQSYRISYDFLAGNVMGGSTVEFEVIGNTTSYFESTSSEIGSPYWESFEHVFVADSVSTQFSLSAKSLGLDDWSGPQIDHLQVSAVPEPSTSFVCIGLLFGVCCKRRHKSA